MQSRGRRVPAAAPAFDLMVIVTLGYFAASPVESRVTYYFAASPVESLWKFE